MLPEHRIVLTKVGAVTRALEDAGTVTGDLETKVYNQTHRGACHATTPNAVHRAAAHDRRGGFGDVVECDDVGGAVELSGENLQGDRKLYVRTYAHLGTNDPRTPTIGLSIEGLVEPTP
jgi:hypothetical protein